MGLWNVAMQWPPQKAPDTLITPFQSGELGPLPSEVHVFTHVAFFAEPKRPNLALLGKQCRAGLEAGKG